MKKLIGLVCIGLVIAVSFTFALPPGKAVAETEPNDTPAQANSLPLGTVGDTSATIGTNTDVDWYQVNLTQDHWYILETYNLSTLLDTYIELYASNTTTGLASDISSGSGNSYSRIVYRPALSGNYYLKVQSAYNSSAGPYSIRVLQKYDEGGTWDGTLEPNDDWQTSNSILVGRENAITSTIYPNGPYSTNRQDRDFYHFTAQLGHWYQIETYNVATTLNAAIALYGLDGTTKLDERAGNGTGNTYSRILWQAPQDGVYFLQVYPYYSTEGQYSLRILPKYDEGGSWDAGWEPDDEWMTASPIILNQNQTRSIYERGIFTTYTSDRDYFWFYAQAGYQYSASLVNVAPTLSLNLYIYSLDHATVLTSDEHYTNPGSLKSVSYTFATPGIYYIMIRPQSDGSNFLGTYQMRVTSVVPAIKVNQENVVINLKPNQTSSPHQTLTISNSGTGSFDWSIVSDSAWLKISRSSGNTATNPSLEVWADLSGLSVGEYQGSLTVTASGIENSPYVIPVSTKIVSKQNVYLPLTWR